RSPLTTDTIEGRAASLSDALDLAVAAGTHASLSFAVIDAEGVLKRPDAAVRLYVVAQRGATGRHRLADDVTDRGGETLGSRRRSLRASYDGAGRACWRQASSKQCLAHVDVAEAGDETLIEKRGLQRRF